MKPALALPLLVFAWGCAGSRSAAEPTAFDQSLATELAQMVEADQAAILAVIAAQDPEQRQELTRNKDRLIEKQSARVRGIFETTGYPGFDRVGEEGSYHFWLLVQHSDGDPAFQRRVLRAMKEEVDRENADSADYAYLWDRVCTNTGQVQRYGTQVTYTAEGQAVPRELEDPKQVNPRRAEVGLPPIEDYLNHMSDTHFQMNQAMLEERGISAPLHYEPGHSTRARFEAGLPLDP